MIFIFVNLLIHFSRLNLHLGMLPFALPVPVMWNSKMERPRRPDGESFGSGIERYWVPLKGSNPTPAGRKFNLSSFVIGCRTTLWHSAKSATTTSGHLVEQPVASNLGGEIYWSFAWSLLIPTCWAQGDLLKGTCLSAEHPTFLLKRLVWNQGPPRI